MSELAGRSCKMTSILTMMGNGILLAFGLKYAIESAYVYDGWTQFYRLSIFSIIISILNIIILYSFKCVTRRQYTTLIHIFSILITVMGILAGICGIILLFSQYNFKNKTSYNMEQIFRNYSDSESISNSKELVDRIQQTYECCGYDKPNDWQTILNERDTSDSCCIKISPDCGKDALINQNNIYSRGCVEPLATHFGNKYNTLMVLNFFILVITLITAQMGFVYHQVLSDDKKK